MQSLLKKGLLSFAVFISLFAITVNASTDPFVQAEINRSSQKMHIKGKSEAHAFVPILVFDTDGNLVYANQVQSDSNGNFSVSFKLEKGIGSGYKVMAGSLEAMPTLITDSKEGSSVILEPPVISLKQVEQELLDAVLAMLVETQAHIHTLDQADVSERIQVITASAETVRSLLGFIEAQSEMHRLVDAFISYVGEIKNEAETRIGKSIDTFKLQQTVVRLAEQYTALAGTKVVSAVRANDTYEAMLTFSEQQDMIMKAGKAAHEARKLEQALQDASMASDISRTVVAAFERSFHEDSSLQIMLPADLISRLKQSVNTLQVKTHFASVFIPINDVILSEQDMLIVRLTNETEPEAVTFEVAIRNRQGEERLISHFDRSIKVIVSLQLDRDMMTSTLAAIHDGQTNVGGYFDVRNSAFIFNTTATGSFVVKQKQNRFSDLSEAAWSEHFVNQLTAKGIIDALSETTFSPQKSIEHSRLVSWFINLLQALKPEFVHLFEMAVTDMPIEREGMVTRQDLAFITSLALVAAGIPEIEHDKKSTSFLDWHTIPPNNQASMANVINYDIIVGRGNNAIAPHAYTTRAEAAAVIYKVLHLMK